MRTAQQLYMGLEIPGDVSLVSPSTRHTGIPTSSRVHAEDSSASRFVSCVGGPHIELSMCFFRSSSVDGGEGHYAGLGATVVSLTQWVILEIGGLEKYPDVALKVHLFGRKWRPLQQ